MENLRGRYFFILVISIIFVSSNYAFADNETSNEHGNVKTTEKIYYKDTDLKTIKIFGEVHNVNKGDKVTITITEPDGERGGSQIYPTEDGYYETFHLVQNNSPLGTYQIDATFRGKIIGTIYFEIAHVSERPIPEPVIEEKIEPIKEEKPEPVIEEKPKTKPILSFVDQNKDPAHYVKRYVNELEYQKWFNEHFPDYKIWEGIGISQQEYQNIVNDLNMIEQQDSVPEVESILYELFPTREQFNSEWQSPTNKRVIDEIERTRNLVPSNFEGYVEHGWRGYIKDQGTFSQNHLDLYIYRFDSTVNAETFWSNHVNHWENRGGYKKWSPSTWDVDADGCFGRTIQGMMWDKLSLYCQKNEIVTVVSAAGYEWEMKDEVNDFSDTVFDNLKKIQKKTEKTSEITSNEDNFEFQLFDQNTIDSCIKSNSFDYFLDNCLPLLGVVSAVGGVIGIPIGIVWAIKGKRKKSLPPQSTIQEESTPVQYVKQELATQTLSLTCRKCNSPIQENAKFCSNCGSSAVPKPSTRRGLVCTNCKNLLKPGEKFCGKCGCPYVPKVNDRTGQVCTNCYNSLKASEKFCGKCGNPV